MKVKELIEKLNQCDPESDVEFAYEQDDPTNGNAITSVIEIKFFDGFTPDVVVLRS